MTPDELRVRIARIREGIEEACQRAGRDPSEVLVVAVTKAVPLEVVRLAREAGLEHFGENYAAELAAKAREVPATWHFIGTLQAGNAPRIADHADVLHSAHPGRALERVARRVRGRGKVLPCLVQVDFTARRHGVPPEEVEDAVAEASRLEGIEVVGLMTLPPWTGRAEDARPYFARLRGLRDRLRGRWPGLAELSMGMSGDYQVAVEEGATMVRLGTALFGERPAPGRGGPGGNGATEPVGR